MPEAQVQLDDDVPQQGGEQAVVKRTPEALLAQARREDAAHRATHQKPISADTLRVRLGIGATRARRLVKAIREEYQVQRDQIEVDATSEEQRASASLAA
ncbi:hypothetical protein GCM10018954_018670 [Kutzneria kofuensis]